MNPEAMMPDTYVAPARALPPVGAKVKLTSDGPRWWDVRCADERFAILTRQAAFKPKGEVCYTILDIEQGVRGPCNLIGQGWHETMPDEACAELLAELQLGARFTTPGLTVAELANHGWGVEISHRNRVLLDIGEVRQAPAKETRTRRRIREAVESRGYAVVSINYEPWYNAGEMMGIGGGWSIVLNRDFLEPSMLRSYPARCRCKQEYTDWDEHLATSAGTRCGIACQHL